MEIDKIAILRFDFAFSDRKCKVVEGLETWYGTKGESYFEVSFGQEQQSENIHFEDTIDTNEESPASDLEHFSSVETTLAEQSQYFIDIITIGQLTEEAQKTLLKEDGGTEILADFQDELSNIESYIPLVSDEDGRTGEVIQIFPEENWRLTDDDDDLDIAHIQTKLEEVSKELTNINFHTLSYISLLHGLGGRHIVVPQFPAQVWGPLLSIQVQFTNDPEGESPWLPFWFGTFQLLTPYFRSHKWLTYQIESIEEIDSKTYKADSIIDSKETSEVSAELEKIQKAEKKLAKIRRNWIDSYTRISDEFEELKYTHTEIFEERTDRDSPEEVPEMEGEIRIPKPQKTGLLVGETSLLEVYRENLDEKFEYLESSLDRIEQKQTHISEFIHDELTAQATIANLDLQKRVKFLTWVLLFLTSVLVILTVILVIEAIGVI